MPVSPILRRQNQRSPVQYQNKYNLTSSDVGLDFLMSKDTGPNYEVHFAVQINPPAHRVDPDKPITPRTVDMSSLRRAIVQSIRPYDRKYMLIKSFDTNKVIFQFNHEKWLKDATRMMKPKVHLSSFDKQFRLKKSPPKMILTDFVRRPFEEFVVRKFRQWLEKNSRQEQKWFGDLFPREIRRKIRIAIRNMFDWEYDTQWNRIIATLKPIYILALMYATGHVVKKLKKDRIRKEDRKDFSKKVKENIRDFDRKKWRKFTRQSFV